MPVAPADQLALIQNMCDRVVCLQSTGSFGAIGEFARDFDQVDDGRVVELLRSVGRASAGGLINRVAALAPGAPNGLIQTTRTAVRTDSELRRLPAGRYAHLWHSQPA